MRFFVVLSSLLVMLLSGSIAKASEVVKITQYPIPGLLDAKGKGLLIDYLDHLAKEAGLKFEYIIQPPRRAYRSVGAGEADGFFGYLVPETEKARKAIPGKLSKFTFSNMRYTLYTAKKIDTSSTKKLKLITTYAYSNIFKEKVKPTKCIECGLKRVLAGRADGFIHVDVVMDPIIQKAGLEGIQKQPFKILPMKTLYRKDLPEEIAEKVRKAFIKTVQNGAYERVMGIAADPLILKKYKESSE